MAISAQRVAVESTPSRPDHIELSVVGSFVKARLPDDIELFVKDGICVDRRNGTPMEMDAYSLYLGLKALENVSGRSYETERGVLVRAVLKRMNDCDGFWAHGAWTGSPNEIHMRFTAAAIRLLIEAHVDGIGVSKSQVLLALKRHLGFSEQLGQGTWFLHDSLELPHAELEHHRRTDNYAFGSSAENCMVLNTHVDTLVTIMHTLRRVDVDKADRVALLSSLASGIDALKYVLDSPKTAAWIAFSRVDSRLRDALFLTYGYSGTFSRTVQSLIKRKYFPVRKRIRARLPMFVFSDGYLERDISLAGTNFEYHLVNLYDLSRLIAEADEAGLSLDKDVMSRCETLIDTGLDYCIRTHYWKYLIASTAETTRAILICEVIVARTRKLGLRTPKHWIRAYCEIRLILPRTPALFSYDPVILPPPKPDMGFESDNDLVWLTKDRLLIADLSSKTFVWKELASHIEEALHGS